MKEGQSRMGERNLKEGQSMKEGRTAGRTEEKYEGTMERNNIKGGGKMAVK